MAVREAYTFPDVLRLVQAAYAAKASFRRVAREDFGGRVSHVVVARILAGQEPKRPAIREALGLAPIARVCPANGANVAQDALVIRSSIECACGCSQNFIPRHPRQRYLPGHRRRRVSPGP
uniref:Uncharacterized protein n=1 Tax=viral metagenome TaxID=1070528 RepID=A0A6M3IU93_9ZZZZ